MWEKAGPHACTASDVGAAPAAAARAAAVPAAAARAQYLGRWSREWGAALLLAAAAAAAAVENAAAEGPAEAGPPEGGLTADAWQQAATETQEGLMRTHLSARPACVSTPVVDHATCCPLRCPALLCLPLGQPHELRYEHPCRGAPVPARKPAPAASTARTGVLVAGAAAAVGLAREGRT